MASPPAGVTALAAAALPSRRRRRCWSLGGSLPAARLPWCFILQEVALPAPFPFSNVRTGRMCAGTCTPMSFSSTSTKFGMCVTMLKNWSAFMQQPSP